MIVHRWTIQGGNPAMSEDALTHAPNAAPQTGAGQASEGGAARQGAAGASKGASGQKTGVVLTKL